MPHNQYAALVYPTELASDEDNGDEQQQRSQGERGELKNTGTNSRQVLVSSRNQRSSASINMRRELYISFRPARANCRSLASLGMTILVS